MRVRLGLNGLGFYRLEEATDNQLSLAVNESLGHVLFSRESIGRLQRLDSERSRKHMTERQEIIQTVAFMCPRPNKYLKWINKTSCETQVIKYYFTAIFDDVQRLKPHVCSLGHLSYNFTGGQEKLPLLVQKPYLTRCFTNFSLLLTAGVFLCITGTCA